jgi:hypothetical protein
MTEHQMTKSEVATRELIFLRAADTMDTFASEQAARRPEREVPAEALAAFAPEDFIHPPESFTYGPDVRTHSMRSSMPLASRRPRHRVALTALGVATAVAAFFLVERSTERVSPPIAPSEPSTLAPEVNAPAPVPPVVVADGSQPVVEVSQPPSPSPLVPEIEAAPPRPVLPVTPRIDPPRAAGPSSSPLREASASSSPPREASASSSRSRQLPSTALVTPVAPPRSQAPPRVVGVPAPPPSRPSDVVPDAAVPAPAASVAAPIAEPALSPPAAPPASAALVPAPSPSTAPAPSPTTAPPAPASVAASAVESNTSAIQNTLARYRKAFSALDAGAAHQVWPTVNERTLQRAFARLEQQDVSFEGCRIAADLERAEATCVGTASYVPRVGSRTLRIDRRQWRFSLVKVRNEWLIGAVDAQ